MRRHTAREEWAQKRTAGDDIDAAHLAQHHAAFVARAKRGRRLGVRVVHLRCGRAGLEVFVWRIFVWHGHEI